MAVRFAALALAVLVCAAIADDGIPLAALEADGECAVGDGSCALNALQRRAQSRGDQEAEAMDDEEEAVYDEGEVVADPGDGGAAGLELLEGYGGDAKCCLCSNGLISWSSTGGCSRCGRSGLKRKTSPKYGCQSPKDRAFPGSQTCASRCAAGVQPYGDAKCCLCKNDVVSWSVSGDCSRCKSSGIKRKMKPTRGCLSAHDKAFPGGQTCASRCQHSLPHAGPSPGPFPRPSPGPAPAQCLAATDGTCKLFGCAASRGGKDAVLCVKGKCACKTANGYCSDGHKCARRGH
eukprot:CAMPEP_0171183788 /NCGR_PEP_ID=MMETSP0790-20130122/15457_1 /TAXON_ID=2925 /ORGANISM="Alexandrium catenella, Strain OF101" /LENGTH=290 /DNA_ID=CAMNT_0011648771 /DNA_START=58 /DNA_END=930 /DNA_ORIENTATION=+